MADNGYPWIIRWISERSGNLASLRGATRAVLHSEQYRHSCQEVSLTPQCRRGTDLPANQESARTNKADRQELQGDRGGGQETLPTVTVSHCAKVQLPHESMQRE